MLHPLINTTDIRLSEKILFKKINVFDQERIDFIKNLGNIDLQAVPGSGKTTALLAKIISLHNHQPFKDNSGILVISHTNAAVDEIFERIKIYCPNLCLYPNFVGTIQSFINKFLAFPYYRFITKRNINFVDQGIYSDVCLKHFNNHLSFASRRWISNRYDVDSFILNLRFDINFNLINGINGTHETFPLKDQNSLTYRNLKNLKLDLINKGYLHFDDSYLLANLYLIKYSKI